MARIRTIKPEFPQSESMGRVSRDARLAFILMWPHCDDVGRLRASSRALASLLFPFDDDAPKLILKWLSELEKEQCITRYEVDGSHYLQVENFLKHQKIDHPSKSNIPAPLESSPVTREPSRIVALDQGKEGTKERKGKEGTKEGICAAPSALTLVSDQDNPVVISFPTNKAKEEYHVFQSHFDQFASLYPAVDVAQELRAMAGWLISNPTNVKTKSGTPRFINSWLSKAQNRSKPNGHGKPTKNDNWLAGAAALREEIRADEE